MNLIDLSSHNIGEAIFKDGKVLIGDASHWQGIMNLVQAIVAGMDGAILKATEGTSYKNATIKNITTANVTQINTALGNVRTVLKVAALAIINMRGLFVLTSKLLIYIRDLTIRFR